jgi:hypothetical protein
MRRWGRVAAWWNGIELGTENGRQIVVKGAVNVVFQKPEKDARAFHAFMLAMALTGAGVFRAALIGVMVGMGGRRVYRRRRSAVRPAGVRMMPATAEHRVNRQNGSRQMWK